MKRLFGSSLLAVAVGLFAGACGTEPGGEETRNLPPIQSNPGAEDEYDIRPTGSYNIQGATWNTAQAFSVGTGVLQPFLRVQGSANDFDDNSGTEEGFNTDARPNVYDQDNAATHHHSLALNHVPVIKVGGNFFRELILDANEANADPAANFSIDTFDLWLCEENAGDPTMFNEYSDFEGGAGGHCSLVYSIDDGGGADHILATDASSKGSGSSFDYQILIPEANFTAAGAAVGVDLDQCGYAGVGATPCGAWLLLKVQLGGEGGDFVVGSTFEEFATLARPFVTVTKTATPSFTRRYNWVIQKSVDPTSIVLFEGQSQNATWTITVSPGDPPFTDTDAQVSGTITIANTSGDEVTINSVADAIPGYPGITPSCGVTFPHILANNQTLVCTYSVAAPSVDPGTTHTNTATVEIEAALDESDPAEAVVFTGSADFDFGDVTPTEIDKNPDVYDNYNSGGEALIGQADDSPFSFVRTYTCDGDEGTFSNIARVDLTPPATDPTATATLTVDCLDVTVTKTSDESRTDTYNWLIDKSVTPASWELFKNDDGTSAYTVTVTPNGVTPSAESVSGVITITGDPSAPIFIQSHITDAISPGGFTPAVTDCEDNGSDVTTPLVVPYTLAAGHVLTCDYTQTLPNSDTRTNTASVVAKPTPSGTSKTFTGSASVDFSGVTLTEINKTVHVDDTFAGGPQDALVTDLVNPTVFNYNRTFTCNGDAGTHNNTATITETGQSDNASVTVTCRSVTVTKDANTSFDRDFNWDIDKSADQTGPLLLMPGQTFNVNYTIVVTKTGPFDSNWQVEGEITVTHNHTTLGAVLNSVSDVVSGVGAASVTGCEVGGSPFSFPGTLAVGATLTCDYSLALPDASSRTNTATATQQNHSYSSTLVATPTGTTDWTGTAAVTFGAPTNVTDNCAVVTDTFGGSLGTICASQTFTYTRAVTAPSASCDDFTVDNTATVTPDDDPPESDSWSILIDVQCPEGCTLTLGYWKTHNESFGGGAPPDDNWLNITPNAELTGFFTTDGANSYPTTGPNTPPFTWFTVFWTNPKGNAYYQLAQQYMAAKLNILNGADPSAVTAAILAAETLFATYTPADIGALKGNDPLRQQFISLAGTLGSYNEGTIGPGHCSEDATSLLTR